jgi:hypothetical protein
VTESGIATGDDVARLRAAGFDAFLIGESLMRQADPGSALCELLALTHEPKPVRGDPDAQPHEPRPVRGDPDAGTAMAR